MIIATTIKCAPGSGGIEFQSFNLKKQDVQEKDNLLGTDSLLIGSGAEAQNKLNLQVKQPIQTQQTIGQVSLQSGQVSLQIGQENNQSKKSTTYYQNKTSTNDGLKELGFMFGRDNNTALDQKLQEMMKRQTEDCSCWDNARALLFLPEPTNDEKLALREAIGKLDINENKTKNIFRSLTCSFARIVDSDMSFQNIIVHHYNLNEFLMKNPGKTYKDYQKEEETKFFCYFFFVSFFSSLQTLNNKDSQFKPIMEKTQKLIQAILFVDTQEVINLLSEDIKKFSPTKQLDDKEIRKFINELSDVTTNFVKFGFITSKDNNSVANQTFMEQIKNMNPETKIFFAGLSVLILIKVMKN